MRKKLAASLILTVAAYTAATWIVWDDVKDMLRKLRV
jgi:hypothetical protein